MVVCKLFKATSCKAESKVFTVFKNYILLCSVKKNYEQMLVNFTVI